MTLYFYIIASEVLFLGFYQLNIYSASGWWSRPTVFGGVILSGLLFLFILFGYLGYFYDVYPRKTALLLNKLTLKKNYVFLFTFFGFALFSFALLFMMPEILPLPLAQVILRNKHLLFFAVFLALQSLIVLAVLYFKINTPNIKMLDIIQAHEKKCVATVQLLLIFLFFFPTFLQSKLPINSDYLLYFDPWREIPRDENSLINNVLSDSVDYNYPTYSFFINSLKKGDFPLWNPNVSSGTPFGFLLFTYSFSLISISNLIVGVTWGMVLYFFLKLFFLGFFTYLFLRQCGLSMLAGIFGMVVVSFSSIMIAELAGPVTDSVTFLVIMLFYGELYIKSPATRYFIAMAVSVMFALLSGFPSVTFYSLLLASFYFSYRLFFGKDFFYTIPKRVTLLLSIAATFLVGILLSMFSLLPTLEFFSNISLAYREGKGAATLPVEIVWRMLSGNICGNPVRGNWICYSNFNETAVYVGVLPWLLLPFAWLNVKFRNISIFFGSASLVILLTVFGFWDQWNLLLAKLPIFSFNPSTRLIALLPFCMGVLGALGMDGILNFYTKGLRTFFITIGFTALAIIILNLPTLNPHFSEKPDFVTEQLYVTAGLVFVVGLVIVMVIGSEVAIVRRALALLLILFAFGDLGYLLYDYNGASDPSKFFPVTPGVRYLLDHQTQYERMMPISNRVMAPSFPLYFSINTLFGHWWTSPTYREMTAQIDPGLFEYGVSTQPIFKSDTVDLSSPLIDVFRVKHLILSPSDTFFPWSANLANQLEYNNAIPLSGFNTISQGVLAKKDIIVNSIQLRLKTSSSQDVFVHFTLYVDKIIKREISLQLVPLQQSDWYGFEFQPQEVFKGQEVIVEISPITPVKETFIYTINFDSYHDGDLFIDNNLVESDLAFAINGVDNVIKNKYKLVYQGDIMIYENIALPDSLPVVFNVRLTNEEECTGLLRTTDMYSEALVTQFIDDLPSNALDQELNGKAVITSYSNDNLQIQAELNRTGLIVLSDTWFPDWETTVDGVKQDVLRVNCNMRGVIVQEGVHTIEMSYKPNSVKKGGLVSLFTLFGLFVLLMKLRKA